MLLGGFTLDLEGEPTPPPAQRTVPSPARSPSPVPSQSPRHREKDGDFSNTADEESGGRDGVSRFFAGLQHLSRGSGSTSGGWGGGWGSGSGGGRGGGARGSHSLPWQDHQRAIIQSLRQSGASLSSFLGFNGSASGSDLSDNGGGDADQTGSCARKKSSGPAATGGLPGAQRDRDSSFSKANRREGGTAESDGEKTKDEKMGDRTSGMGGVDGYGKQAGYDGAMAAAEGGSLAVLSLGEISFEVGCQQRDS